MLDKWFKLSERGTTVKTEIMAGITTFMTLAYILAVNPSTLSAPIFTAIPAFATAPALIMVGFLMFSSITDIHLADGNLTEIIPAFLTILAMPFFNSISEGICIGIISYVILNLVTGKGKKVPVLLYILAVLFVLKYIFI